MKDVPRACVGAVCVHIIIQHTLIYCDVTIYVYSGLNTNTGEVVAVKKFERAKVSSTQISSVMVWDVCSLWLLVTLYVSSSR